MVRESVQGSVLLCAFTGKYLFAKLNQDIIEFSHQVTVDGFSRTDVLEFQEHVKRSGRRAQRLKRMIDKGDGLFFNILRDNKYSKDPTLFPKSQFYLCRCCKPTLTAVLKSCMIFLQLLRLQMLKGLKSTSSIGRDSSPTLHRISSTCLGSPVTYFRSGPKILPNSSKAYTRRILVTIIIIV